MTIKNSNLLGEEPERRRSVGRPACVISAAGRKQWKRAGQAPGHARNTALRGWGDAMSARSVFSTWLVERIRSITRRVLVKLALVW